MTSSAHNQRRAYIAWAVVCVVWGTTYLGIRIALETIPPLMMAAFRWIAAIAGGNHFQCNPNAEIRRPQTMQTTAQAM